MKRISLCLVLFSISAEGVLARAYEALPARNGNYCIEDIYQFFEQRFQSADKVKSTRKISATAGSSWYYYVTTNFCSGYIVADMGAGDSSICTNPQYGQRIQTIRRIFATGQCQAYLPNDEFPS